MMQISFYWHIDTTVLCSIVFFETLVIQLMAKLHTSLLKHAKSQKNIVLKKFFGPNFISLPKFFYFFLHISQFYISLSCLDRITLNFYLYIYMYDNFSVILHLILKKKYVQAILPLYAILRLSLNINDIFRHNYASFGT